LSELVRRYLVAYDISDDARRERVAVVLQAFGERVQYSVFLVDGKPADFIRLRARLKRLISGGSDRIILCDLGPREFARERIDYLGRTAQLIGDSDALIV
jgi:CRISPR-associated protein Cas2